ncbi:MAG: hypothetical protein DRP71_13775 [Verrucomicrobia bacterium]|nr:MAG: hypothetical protein DRP71_13775 [Verrucomicrobiota bacterium]
MDGTDDPATLRYAGTGWMTEKRVDCPAFHTKTIWEQNLTHLTSHISHQPSYISHQPSAISHLPPSLPPLSRPVVLFDGDCDFCRFWVDRWQARSGDRMDFLPYQEVSDRFPFFREQDLEEAVHLVEPGGLIHRGAAAVIRLRELGMDRHRLARIHRKHRWFAAGCEWGYRRIARNRTFFACLTRRFDRRKSG